MQGQGSAVKDWRALSGSLGKMQGQGSAAKNWRALPLGGYPAIFGKNAGQGSAVKNWRALPLGGYPSSLGKMQGQGSAAKMLPVGGYPLSLGKMKGQGSAVKSWSALLGKCRGKAVQQKIGERYRWGATPLSLAKMARQCSKFGERCWGLPLYLAGAGQCSKNLASATAGGRPLYLWEKHGSPTCNPESEVNFWLKRRRAYLCVGQPTRA